MFTWICPQCGREVPPSYSECPDCAERSKGNAAANAPSPAGQPPAAQPSSAGADAAPPAAVAPSPAPGAAPKVEYVVVKHGLPGWLVALFVAAVLVIVGAGAYLFLLPSSRVEQEQQPEIQLQAPPPAGQTTSSSNPYARFLDATGVRLYEENKKLMVKVLLVNHSPADMAALEGVITLQTTAAKPDAPPLAQIPLKIASIPPYGSQEVSAQVKTTLRAYEMPDWQFVRATVELKQP